MKLVIPESIKSLTCKEVMDNHFRVFDFETRCQLHHFGMRSIISVWDQLSAAVRCEVIAHV